mmetsp:Transcript_76531/g.135142  ORF Transcript_76531/g.135142 Transcript_76531/m.135142 type:complete len:84 (+) Transcript_76531:21-272(+)
MGRNPIGCIWGYMAQIAIPRALPQGATHHNKVDQNGKKRIMAPKCATWSQGPEDRAPTKKVVTPTKTGTIFLLHYFTQLGSNA